MGHFKMPRLQMPCLQTGVFQMVGTVMPPITLHRHAIYLWLSHDQEHCTFSPQATVTTVWKTPVCKWGVCKRGILKCPVSYVMNFRGWIKLIYDKITSIYCVDNVFNPTSLNFSTLKMGCFKMLCLHTPHL